jgi:hypothetical protein
MDERPPASFQLEKLIVAAQARLCRDNDLDVRSGGSSDERYRA